MLDAIIFLKNNLADHFVIYFIPLYILGGRPVFYYLYGTISKGVFMRKLYERATKKEKRLRKSRLFRWVQVMGTPGVVAITLLPLKGCGMWSGVLLSKLLRLPKQISYPLLIVGSILGCVFLFGVGEVILQLKDLFVNR